ncbi:MAG: type II toxin-antitoxin system prevent-host-death family antitoxin, partial [Deltaproteobacteria bacterium]
MVTVPARDLKNRTGEIVRRIERGEHLLITKRGKP